MVPPGGLSAPDTAVQSVRLPLQADDFRAAVLDTLASVAPETDLQSLRTDVPLRQQIDLDSIDWLNVVVGLCERLSVDIPESDYARLATLDQIVAYVVTNQEKPGSAPRPAGEASGSELPSTRHVVRATIVTVRPMRAGDRELEVAFVQQLSKESRYDRFMTTVVELPEAKLKSLTDVDQIGHVALVATIDRDGREVMIGVVRYAVDQAGTGCEFAVAVGDEWQGSGLAGILMQALIDVARRRGLATMDGTVLAINGRMLKFMRQLGFRQERDPADRETVRVVKTLTAPR